MREPIPFRAAKQWRRWACIVALVVFISNCTTYPDRQVLPEDSVLYENVNSQKLVVFLHDLGGDPVDAWVDPENQIPFVWPEQLAKEKGFYNIDVLSFAYPSGCGPEFSIPKASEKLASDINELLPKHEYNSIAFVAHGVGGLVAREFILNSPENLSRPLRLDKIVTLGTPNLASGHKNVAAFFCGNGEGNLMAVDRGYLDPLNQRWREEFLQPESRRTFNLYAGYEMVPYRGQGVIVGKEAATLFSDASQPFIKTHTNLSRPTGSADPLYLWVRQLLLNKPRDPRVTRYADPEVIRTEEVIRRMQDELAGNDLEPVLKMVSRGAPEDAQGWLSAFEQKVDEKSFNYGLIQFTRGRLYELTLDHRNALHFYEKAVQQAPDNSTYLNDTGVVHLIRGDYDTARDYFEKALESDLKLVGSDHPNVAVHWNYLGDLWRKQGNSAKAIGYYEKSLDSFLKTIGPEHPFVARIWNNLGTAHYNNGQYDLAVANWQKSLDTEMKIFDGNHPAIAQRWNDLGEAWRKKGEYDKAIDLHEKALASDLKTYGPDHPVVARDWNRLGEVWRNKGEYERSIEYHEKALLSDMKALGPADESVAHDWTNLGTVWHKKGDQDRAISYYDKALDSFSSIYGQGHPNVAILWNNLGSAWKAKGEEDRALDFYEKALASNLKTLGPKHPIVAHDWNNLASLWHDRGEYDRAMEYYEKARAIFQEARLPHKVAVVETNIERTLKKKDLQAVGARAGGS